MRFYLGTHMPSHLTQTDVPLFVSIRRLRGMVQLPRARGAWALDSGGFTELQMFGRWSVSPEQYAREVRRVRDEIGNLEWAAPQDWMCEPFVISGGRAGPVTFAGTGLSVAEHQRRTVENYLTLRALAPDLPFIPVLQGWDYDDYFAHAEQYAEAGVDLRVQRCVGLGSVCRRQSLAWVGALAAQLQARGLRLHGFGVKTDGLANVARYLHSSDSLAWSYRARRSPPIEGHAHKSCANCLPWALRWRDELLARIGEFQRRGTQLVFGGMAHAHAG